MMKTKNCKAGGTMEVLLGVVAEGAALNTAAGGAMADAVATWLGPQYLVAAKEKMEAADDAERYAALQAFIADWARLRRGEHLAGRLQLKREELELRRAKMAWQKEMEFDYWIKRPDIREKYFPEKTGGITPETLAKIEKELRLF